MLIVQDESILSLVPDYRINLIAPGEMSEEELELFTSNFREVMQFIKYSKDTEKLSQLVVNVCKAIQGIEEKGRIAGLAEGRAAGLAEGKEALEREQKLTKFLLCDNRIDDLKRALDDSAFRQKLLEEYGID